MSMLSALRFVVGVPVIAVLAACSAETVSAPVPASRSAASPSVSASPVETQAFASLRRATARYHDLDAAIADGFVFLHPCELRGDGAVGTVYVHPGRLMDGVLNYDTPDALVYARGPQGQMQLAAVEMAIPYVLWSSPVPPTLLGQTFQPEDEFQVYGLHVWVWQHNPNGMYAEANPRLSCAS